VLPFRRLLAPKARSMRHTSTALNPFPLPPYRRGMSPPAVAAPGAMSAGPAQLVEHARRPPRWPSEAGRRPDVSTGGRGGTLRLMGEKEEFTTPATRGTRRTGQELSLCHDDPDHDRGRLTLLALDRGTVVGAGCGLADLRVSAC